ncbi:MAG: twin transmembrane helix small protein [Pseudomonadota bacterium]
MADGVFVLGVLACLAVAGILIYGIRGFGTGSLTPKQQNKVMQWRIMAQFGAVVILLIAFAMSG